MNLTITRPDSFHILASTKAVMEGARFVSVDEGALQKSTEQIREYLKDRAEFPDHSKGLTGDFDTDAQLIFFESMLAFCFWALPGKPKWAIEMPDGEKVDGWYGVCASFKRAYDEGVPVADANFLAKATRDDVRNIFRTTTGVDIPLLDERVVILNQNAQSLLAHFGGRFSNVLDASGNDAVKLLEMLLTYFPSYRDVTAYNGREVVFLKIAHLLALDLEYRLTPQSQRPFLKNFDQLCVFADYKLPQLLRMFGVLGYEQSLANIVDSYTVIPKGSAQEIEIRAGAIWGIELLRQQLPQYSSIQIGHAIWLMSQNQDLQARIKPYHRTLTTFY